MLEMSLDYLNASNYMSTSVGDNTFRFVLSIAFYGKR